MILAGKPPASTPRAILTSVSIIEAMAERYHAPLEATADAMFLSVNGVTWYAILPPAGCAA